MGPIARTISSLALGLAMASLQGQTYTALTWNIRYDRPQDSLDRWDLRKEALAKEVLQIRPQVVALQEVLWNQAEYLDEQWPGYRRFGVGRDDGLKSGEYSPVYYDTTVFTLLNGRTVWLSETPDRPGFGWDASCNRVASMVTLHDRTTGDSLWVVSTHWDHEGRRARVESARLIHAQLAPILARGRRVILMGDMNAKPHAAPVRYLRKHFTDANRGAPRRGTFNHFKLRKHCFKRIDYIWLSPGTFVVTSFDVPQPRVNGRQMSDHFPVVVTLQVR
jgi:endonuclease/exonuclease/phosphatase family metal-dependent hydrolase